MVFLPIVPPATPGSMSLEPRRDVKLARLLALIVSTILVRLQLGVCHVLMQSMSIRLGVVILAQVAPTISTLC